MSMTVRVALGLILGAVLVATTLPPPTAPNPPQAGMHNAPRAALEAQPRVVREMHPRRIAEAWLKGQREVYRTSQTSSNG